MQAGFELSKIVPTGSGVSVIEGIKPSDKLSVFGNPSAFKTSSPSSHSENLTVRPAPDGFLLRNKPILHWVTEFRIAEKLISDGYSAFCLKT